MTDNQGYRPWIVIVGGFLGSGKTSLILAAAKILNQRGIRCAAILNDQGIDLVDRHHAESRGLVAREVIGGCFCCRLSSLISAIEELRVWSPEVIFAEPVGSCTDISATVFAPLREEFERYRLAPFTVLADPARASSLLMAEADPDLAFLFQKQLQEADLICMTKADLHPEGMIIAGGERRRLSAVTGENIEAWLDEVLQGGMDAGRTILDIDYARYAQAEAALAWLNLSFVFDPTESITPAYAIGPFLERMDRALTDARVEIVHLKIFASSGSGWLKAAVCGPGEEPRLEGNLDSSPANHFEMLVNLRAKGDPAQVRRIILSQLDQLPGSVLKVKLDCFSPAAPQPERRVTSTYM
jgi:hypothetical protein